MVEVIVFSLVYLLHLLTFHLLCLPSLHQPRRYLYLYRGSVIHRPHFQGLLFPLLLLQQRKRTDFAHLGVLPPRLPIGLFRFAGQAVRVEGTVDEGKNLEEHIDGPVRVMSPVKEHKFLMRSVVLIKKLLGVVEVDHFVPSRSEKHNSAIGVEVDLREDI